jgi:hypothetical protein
MVYVQGKTKIYASLIFYSLLHFVEIYNMKKENERRERIRDRQRLLWLHFDCIGFSVLSVLQWFLLIKRLRKWNKASI